MSQADFQSRIQRINEKQPLQTQVDANNPRQAEHHKQRGVSFKYIVLAVVSANAGRHGIKYANENYEVFREGGQILLLLGIALGAAICILSAIYFLVKALPQKGYVPQPKPKISSRAKLVSTVIGILFGLIAGYYFLLSRAIGPDKTGMLENIANGGVMIVVSIGALSLFLGFLGLFLPRLALGRIPVFGYLTAVTFVMIYRMSGADVLTWFDMPQYL